MRRGEEGRGEEAKDRGGKGEVWEGRGEGEVRIGVGRRMLSCGLRPNN